MSRDRIVVLDFGSQYAHLIAKRFRMLGYYSEIEEPSVETEKVKDAKGIVLSGGPASVYDENIPEFNEDILSLDIPVLGLCYGHHVMAKHYGGTVKKAPVGEFGIAYLNKTEARDKNGDSTLKNTIKDASEQVLTYRSALNFKDKNVKAYVMVFAGPDCIYCKQQ